MTTDPIQTASATLVPTAFRAGQQIAGGAVGTPQSVLDAAFSVGRLRNLAQNDETTPTDQMPRAIFGGYTIAQFGHFLIESLGRLPSIPDGMGQLPILFLAGGRRSFDVALWQKNLLQELQVPNPMHIVTQPIQVDELILPPMHFHLNLPGFGDDTGRDWMRTRLRQKLPKNGSKLYVSRSELDAPKGRFAGEAALEDLLRAEGYQILHPQSLSLSDQIAAYQAADKIILAEGSALHLMTLVCAAGQSIAVIQRRPRLSGSLVKATQYFSQSFVVRINALTGFHHRDHPGGRGYSGIGDIDLGYLGTALQDYGFIDNARPFGEPAVIPSDKDGITNFEVGII